VGVQGTSGRESIIRGSVVVICHPISKILTLQLQSVGGREYPLTLSESDLINLVKNISDCENPPSPARDNVHAQEKKIIFAMLGLLVRQQLT
jgi:hypothetical protein